MKAEPDFRFYLLYDKICREDILVHAYRLARVNAGAPGVDGMTFARIEEQGLEAWLAGLRAELVSKTYRPDPVRRVMIPKANGGERPLGIPTIRDRVIQTAAKIVIEPIFEADFEDNAYGQARQEPPGNNLLSGPHAPLHAEPKRQLQGWDAYREISAKTRPLVFARADVAGRGALLAQNAAQPQLGKPTPHLGRLQPNRRTDTVAEA